MGLINDHVDYVTTSSCSGRITLFEDIDGTVCRKVSDMYKGEIDDLWDPLYISTHVVLLFVCSPPSLVVNGFFPVTNR